MNTPRSGFRHPQTPALVRHPGAGSAVLLRLLTVEEAVVLVVLVVVEQRHAAVLEALVDGATVTAVAAGHGVTRQTVHRWLRRYARDGLAGLVDQPSTPKSCPHQMPPEVEAAIVALRRAHPGWGP